MVYNKRLQKNSRAEIDTIPEVLQSRMKELMIILPHRFWHAVTHQLCYFFGASVIPGTNPFEDHGRPRQIPHVQRSRKLLRQFLHAQLPLQMLLHTSTCIVYDIVLNAVLSLIGRNIDIIASLSQHILQHPGVKLSPLTIGKALADLLRLCSVNPADKIIFIFEMIVECGS